MVLPMLLLAALARAEPITPAAEILRSPTASHGKLFCVMGRPGEVSIKVTEHSKKLRFRTLLDDGSGRPLMLFAYGDFPRIQKGELIEACGRFYKFRIKSNGRSYYNELDVAAILRGKLMGTDAVVLGSEVTVNAARRTAPPAP